MASQCGSFDGNGIEYASAAAGMLAGVPTFNFGDGSNWNASFNGGSGG
jgi:hypothetical protein